ncbi:hypothetical protein MKK70_27345 [Methylobacterium sp. E-041]|uniref:hypothetical protein n=1 Tax=Methylobacterium sp. E-041 TaxID=2836573 RepID=UPI001FBAEA51|nr:hypothetical protein [Methylobacterium sp. E-041]MCJ2109017.1 hypothetical protein [Methylobacterium sp. E-041]
MTLSANINVWTLGKGARGAWKLHHTTDSMEDAAGWFTKLEGEGKQVSLYELGLFEHEGQQVAGQVAFWWSTTLNTYMEREPEDRGVGWADGFDTWVAYAIPGSGVAALPTIREEPVPVVTAKPAARYVEASCDRCGMILPMNQLHRHTREVKTGRTSGTRRSSHSTSERYLKSSFSGGTTFSSSSSSGRTFYKTETLLLCEACYAQQTAPRMDPLSRFIRFMTRLD